jgi:hydrophobe/amphiphile efflux-3 (HAE3) family protein
VAAQKDAAAALAQLQVQTGIKGLPSIANSDFVSGIVFDPGKGPGYPKTRFSYLFPSSNSALIQVRPKPGLTGSQRRELIGLVRAATDQRLFKLSSGSYIVTGAPVLAESLADQVAAGALPLLLLAMLVMAAVLALAFRVSFRLLPLLLALSAAAGVFGAMGLLGIPLTVAAVGGVPVLIGLAVDYAVQYQSRVSERASGGADADETLASAAGVGGPPLVAAALATTAGFLALLASPVPMVRGFGLALIAGVALALLLSFTLGSALISVRIESKDSFSRIADRLDAAASDARQILARAPGREQLGAARSSVGLLLSRKPGAVLVVAVVLAVGGWVADSGVGVDSDITRLVPSGTPALRDLQTLQRESGIAGEVDVMLTGAKATDPTTLAWLRDFNSRALRNFGYSEQRGCSGGAELCPGVSITDLVGPVTTTAQAQAALAVLPEYFRNAVVTSDNQSVLSAFGVSLLPLDRQQQIFDYLKAEAAKAPAGVTAQVGSLSVIAAEANSRLADPISRWKITLLALAAVALVLLLTLRSFARAAVPLAATVIATGWAALGLWVFGIELNPISAALGALVIAIATEFAVLLSERQHAELRSGDDAEAALSRALGTTGRAIVVSGSTVVAGFAVLGFSDIRVLRDFGLATVVNLGLALAAVAVVVPALVRSRARRGSDPASGPQSEKAQVD